MFLKVRVDKGAESKGYQFVLRDYCYHFSLIQCQGEGVGKRIQHATRNS
jgi:hypothetical protein